MCAWCIYGNGFVHGTFEIFTFIWTKIDGLFFFVSFVRSLIYHLNVVLMVCCVVHEALEFYVKMRRSKHIHIEICNRKLNQCSNISFFFRGFRYYVELFISIFHFIVPIWPLQMLIIMIKALDYSQFCIMQTIIAKA